ncbi:MAG: copper resistance protein CopC [Actinomycetes bacterium]
MISRFKPLRLFAVVVFAGVALTGIAGPASAHSELVNSNPKADSTLTQAPRQVELVFNEPIQAQGSSIVVTVDGTTVSNSKTFTTQNTTATVRLDSGRVPGTYQVEYRVVSQDGHVVDETFSYTVEGEGASASTDAPASAVTDEDSDESTSSVVWVLGAGAIGLVLVAALIAVAMRGRRGRSS